VPPNEGMELQAKATRPLQREEQRARRFCLQLIPGVRPLLPSGGHMTIYSVLHNITLSAAFQDSPGLLVGE
jgi:hypothetical protein